MLHMLCFLTILFYHTKMDDKKIISFKDADIKKATKGMRGYLDLKSAYPDTILMYRIGDFYETFYEDAYFISQVCDITLTKRKYGELGEVPLAGIPRKSFDIYLKKLLDKNFKVARAEQYRGDDGECERKVVRIYTPATVYENEFLDADSNNYLAAVNKDGDLFGFSYCDVSEGSLFVSYGTKEEVLFELVKISPRELLLASQDLMFVFREVIERFDNTYLCPQYFNAQSAQNGDFKNGYVCANAIIAYLKDSQKSFVTKLDEIKKYSISDFMSLDFNTRRSLELTRMQADFKKKGSLLWFLDNSKTPMGKRLLKQWMNAPLYKCEKILKRQNVLREFCSKPQLLLTLEGFLDNLCDILRYSAKISNKTIKFKELVEISQTLSKAEKIKDILSELESFDLEIDTESLNLLLDFVGIIERTFDLDSEESEFLPIKEYVNDRLDILRVELNALEGQLCALEKVQAEKFSSSIKLKFMPNLGYCFEAPISLYGKIDNSCLVRQKLSSVFRYTTDETIKLEEKMCSLKYQIGELERDIYSKIKDYSSELTSKIRMFARDVAFLDVIYSLTKCVLQFGFCAVNFRQDNVLEIKGGFHPCVKKILGKYTPNDTKTSFLTLLTGANMSGKSTYLKQNALIVMLAQMCGYAPAESVNMALADRIFFHGAIFDNLRENESAFMAEMKNIARILKNSTDKSLILLDEPVKGTNSEDASAILLALCRYFVCIIKSKTIVSTHLLNVAKRALGEEKFDLFYMDSKTKKIKSGIVPSSNAFEVALMAGIDESIIEEAKKYTLG